ncbi:hypothetical protein B0A54_03192 [Friedmanniomyces endolithicus]|uniref:Uncharacterized protein n=1 Tax=Friedmanniomyces endolithicus TaxID=329885 RepID=A0A4U0V7V1_9PEZI|nr:hypothetical protein LTS09_009713 [Friedmanniomyces endolithicus]TKA44901.1 hypothetical protein B0A54_03192 [Friedmanniomyces endolithicus]
MAEPANELFAIEVDADNYAETAAHDAPPVSRTFQSEADFQAQKATYSAKIDVGNNYERLLEAVPLLKPVDEPSPPTERHLQPSGAPPIRLGKKDVQLLGHAVGELYYDKRYRDIIQLCERVNLVCETDGKTAESLRRWTRRCEARLEVQLGEGETTVARTRALDGQGTH